MARHPAEFYSYRCQYISYTNVSTRELMLVVYLSPPLYQPAALVNLKRVTFLPVALPGSSNVLTINNGKDMFVAENR